MKNTGENGPIRSFWAWMRIHEYEVFAAAGNNRETLAGTMASLHRELHRVQEGLVCDIGGSDSGRRQLIISAEGNQSLFPSVIRIVAQAPADLHRFTVRAFRPATGGHLALVYGDLRLATDAMMARVQPLPEGGLHIDAFLQEFAPEDDRYRTLVRLLLMHTLGEYRAVTRVRTLQLHPWPLPHEAVGLIPWVRLPQTAAALIGDN
jgi:hypothetical protein